jgi:hypothetical protein
VVGVGGNVVVVVVVVEVVTGVVVVVRAAVVPGPGSAGSLLHADAKMASVTAITIKRMAPRYKASAAVRLIEAQFLLCGGTARGFADEKTLAAWVKRGTDFARTLPPK